MRILLPEVRPFLRKVLAVVLILAIGAALGWTAASSRQSPSAERGLSLPEVYFSPKGGCTDVIIREIDLATKSILVQAYSFTSDPIEQALIKAHGRGVKVTVIVDARQVNALGAAIVPLASVGIEVFLDKTHAIFHNKVMIIDEYTLITGSFNFSQQAEERNAENLLVFKSPGTAKKYLANWSTHLAHSERFAP
jgi:phosphatidylserine/phosphatidylglycerophosphate/cardiolipin synthase-like enzyme